MKLPTSTTATTTSDDDSTAIQIQSTVAALSLERNQFVAARFPRRASSGRRCFAVRRRTTPRSDSGRRAAFASACMTHARRPRQARRTRRRGRRGVALMTFITVSRRRRGRERIPAGEHLVEDHAERKQVAAAVDAGRRAPARATDSARRRPPAGPAELRRAAAARASGRAPRVQRDMPKSSSLALPFGVTTTFSGRRSPCTMPRAWPSASASAIWMRRSRPRGAD